MQYHLDAQYAHLFQQVGINTGEVLRKAGIAEDIFTRPQATVSGTEYLSFISAIAALSPDDGLAVRLATTEEIEHFNPPIFAAYCSRDGWHAISRLAEYKPLIGPLRFYLEQESGKVSLFLEHEESSLPLPAFLVEGEFAFLLHVLRKATRSTVNPVQVHMQEQPSATFVDFCGGGISLGNANAIVFRTKDMHLPFYSRHEEMWSFFQPELRRRLSEIHHAEGMATRVRSALIELLPAGENTIEDVARKLHTSTRTLQRQLREEHTTFRKELNHVRHKLARQYLTTTNMTMESISFMLGYRESNSFIRAFNSWEGINPAHYRAQWS